MANANKQSAKEKETTDFKEPRKYKFQSGEKVLCFHGPLIYEAKCLQSRFNEKQNSAEYHIHYSGWNKSWDEWVPERRVLKHNSENVQKQKELYKAQKAEPKGKKSKKRTGADGSSPREQSGGKTGGETKAPVAPVTNNTTATTPTTEAPLRKRPRIDPAVESEEQFLRKIEIKIRIPDELKPWLVDDWELVSKTKKLVQLPAKVNVEKILEDYLAKARTSAKNTPEKEAARTEVANGLIDYFNAMLSSQLLYKVERRQHAELMRSHPNTLPSQLYGAIHLLRLFVRLGGALAYTRLEERSVQSLIGHIADFLKFLHNNRTSHYDSNNDYIPFPEKLETGQSGKSAN